MSFEIFLTAYVGVCVGFLAAYVLTEHKMRKLARKVLEDDRQQRLKDLYG